MGNMILEIEDFNSAGIRAAARELRATLMENLASFGGGDGRTTFYRLLNGTQPGYLMADTNGDPLLGEDAEEALKKLSSVSIHAPARG